MNPAHHKIPKTGRAYTRIQRIPVSDLAGQSQLEGLGHVPSISADLPTRLYSTALYLYLGLLPSMYMLVHRLAHRLRAPGLVAMERHAMSALNHQSRLSHRKISRGH
jgi:hypothetical protein